MKQFKVILSILVQIIALILMICGFMLSGLFSTAKLSAIFMLFLLSGIAIALLILGIHLWSKTKWIVLTGSYLLITGLASLFMSYAFLWNYKNGVKQDIIAADDDHPFIMFSNGCYRMGILVIIIGLIFFIYQYKDLIKRYAHRQ